MIYSDIKVCNRALSFLKLNHINSLEETTAEAIQCKFLYDMVKAEVLSSNIWKVCLKTIVLSNFYNKDSLKKNSYQYEFALPSDCLRILNVDNNSDYLRQGNTLYANSSSVQLTYLANIDVENLPLNLVYLIVLKLALELSFNFSVENTLQKELRELYEIELRKNSNLDAKEGSEVFDNQSLFSSSWLDSRKY
ncbi:MAG: hypothetical protein LBH40_04200 [Alphaproteobacteria bacterium]|jgi:hypothetical protein|nr:hypothetical protein [Alphaproteobacteria bacterium]